MSRQFNPFKNCYKKNFKKKKIPGFHCSLEEPIIYCNHATTGAIDSRNLYPQIPYFQQCAFIDPGVVSCAIRIVRFFPETNLIIPIWFAIHNFGMEITQVMSDMESSIAPILTKFQECNFIVIESQLMKSRTNFRTFQHMISYLEMNTRDKGLRPIIVEVDIKLKTTFLGGPTTKTTNDGVRIKEWSKKFAREVSLRRHDYLSFSILESCCVKQDEDLSDTLCYEFAWWSYYPTISEKIKNKNK